MIMKNGITRRAEDKTQVKRMENVELEEITPF